MVSADSAGKRAKCAACSQLFRIPSSKAVAPPPVPAYRRVQIKDGGFLFGPAVSYDCEKCGEGLESSVKDIGEYDNCPDCGHTYVVPGEAEYAERQKKEEQRKAKAELKRRASTDRTLQERSQEDVQGGLKIDSAIFNHVRQMLQKQQLPGLSGWSIGLQIAAKSKPKAIESVQSFVEKYPEDARSIWLNTPSERGRALYQLLSESAIDESLSRSLVCYVGVATTIRHYIDQFENCRGDRKSLAQVVGEYNVTAREPLLGDFLALVANKLECSSFFSGKLDRDVEKAMALAKARHLKQQLERDGPVSKGSSLQKELRQARQREAAAGLAMNLDINFDPDAYVIVGPDYSRDSRVDRFYRSKFREGLTAAFSGQCVKCGEGMSGLEFDHFWYPKSKGGNFAMRLRKDSGIVYINNCIPLCRTCNASKGPKPYDVFFTVEELQDLLRVNSSITGKLNEVMAECNDNYN